MVSAAPMRQSAAHTAKATSMPSSCASAQPIDPCAAFVTSEDTEMMIAVPSEPATWRNVLLTDVPWFMSLLSSAFMPHVVMGMFTSAMENMRSV